LIVGVPKEVKDHEYRVAITPPGARELVNHGHTVLVEHNAGAGSSMTDADYEDAGATIVTSADQVWSQAGLVLKVKEPVASEYSHLRSDLILFTYLHLAATKALTEALVAAGTTAIAYETVQLPNGSLPLLAPMSEVAGRMAPQVAAHLLEREQGGRGMLIGGAAGVPASNVVVLGGGMAGQQAARVAAGMEANVILLDTNTDKLRYVDDLFQGRIQTRFSTSAAIDSLVPNADVIVGSVLVPGAKAPKLITADHIAQMKPGAVVVDIAVDQGGCFETTHVTTHSEPTYVVDNVVHYAVGNMPGAVPYTSTYALTNVTLPYVLQLAADPQEALRRNQALAKGINTYQGALVNEAVATAHHLDWSNLPFA
jgi:alanine dehydrogenase